MKRLGFRRSASDAGVFFAQVKQNLVVIVVYVDDAIFFGKNLNDIKKVKATFIDTCSVCRSGPCNRNNDRNRTELDRLGPIFRLRLHPKIA